MTRAVDKVLELVLELELVLVLVLVPEVAGLRSNMKSPHGAES